MKTKRSNKPKRSIALYAVVLLLILATIAGLLLVFSPYLENREHRIQVEQKIETFKQLVAVPKDSEPHQDPIETEPEGPQLPEVYPQLWQAMADYNAGIVQNGQAELKDAWSYQAEVLDLTQYGLEADSAVGLIRIPDIAVEMPLYLGASYENLANGFAQLSQTSMPIGGSSTNCVVAGHRGWYGMAYMRDVEQLELGDTVYLQNLWETLEYRIGKILLIKPNELESIYVQEGKDLLTIITCHPYGVGTQRYVLICERFQDPQQFLPEDEMLTPSTEWEWEYRDAVKITVSEGIVFESSQRTIFVFVFLPYFIIGAVGITFVIIFVIILVRRRKRR